MTVYIDPEVPEWWTCDCGNQPNLDGFYPCDEKGRRQTDEGGGPLPEWEGRFLLCSCGRFYNQNLVTGVSIALVETGRVTAT